MAKDIEDERELEQEQRKRVTLKLPSFPPRAGHSLRAWANFLAPVAICSFYRRSALLPSCFSYCPSLLSNQGSLWKYVTAQITGQMGNCPPGKAKPDPHFKRILTFMVLGYCNQRIYIELESPHTCSKFLHYRMWIFSIRNFHVHESYCQNIKSTETCTTGLTPAKSSLMSLS